MCRAEPPLARWGPIGPDGPPRRDRFGPGPRGRRRHRWGVAELRPEALRAATGGPWVRCHDGQWDFLPGIRARVPVPVWVGCTT